MRIAGSRQRLTRSGSKNRVSWIPAIGAASKASSRATALAAIAVGRSRSAHRAKAGSSAMPATGRRRER